IDTMLATIRRVSGSKPKRAACWPVSRDEAIAETSSSTVIVLGAGFTKAFFPAAPLMVDEYDGDAVAEKFLRFERARQLLDTERSSQPDRQINLERLMTRLDTGMPYDASRGGAEELQPLLSELKRIFTRKIEAARE